MDQKLFQKFLKTNDLLLAENGGKVTHILFTDEDLTETLMLEVNKISQIEYDDENEAYTLTYHTNKGRDHKYTPMGSVYGINVPYQKPSMPELPPAETDEDDEDARIIFSRGLEVARSCQNPIEADMTKGVVISYHNLMYPDIDWGEEVMKDTLRRAAGKIEHDTELVQVHRYWDDKVDTVLSVEAPQITQEEDEEYVTMLVRFPGQANAIDYPVEFNSDHGYWEWPEGYLAIIENRNLPTEKVKLEDLPKENQIIIKALALYHMDFDEWHLIPTHKRLASTLDKAKASLSALAQELSLDPKTKLFLDDLGWFD